MIFSNLLIFAKICWKLTHTQYSEDLFFCIDYTALEKKHFLQLENCGSWEVNPRSKELDQSAIKIHKLRFFSILQLSKFLDLSSQASHSYSLQVQYPTPLCIVFHSISRVQMGQIGTNFDRPQIFLLPEWKVNYDFFPKRGLGQFRAWKGRELRLNFGLFWSKETWRKLKHASLNDVFMAEF